MKFKHFSIFLLGIFLISLVSSNGLSLDITSIELNKTSGIDEYFSLTISNQETFTFYNISSQNSVISFDKFDLNSGENKTIQVKSTTNSDFNGQIKIISDYFTDLGSSNITEEITIDSNGLDLCNLDLIVGDTINWKNTLLGNIILKNIDTNEDFATINGESNYSNTFTEQIEFNYQVFKTGFPFSNICHLNIRPTNGYIHSSEYDATLNLNLKISYEPTTISTTFLTEDYSLDYNAQKEDIFQITNTGNKLAKNIKLSGDWFEFDLNNFDLSIGESKNIGYTIKPFIYETEKTNKTYNKSIIIEGNFNTINKQINIFIKHKNLGNIYGNSSYDKEYLKNVVNLFCSVYPDDCPTTIIYGNESERNITFTINEETYKQGILEEDSFREEMKSMLRKYSEDLTLIKDSNNLYINNSKLTSTNVEDLSNKTDDLLGALMFGGIITLVLLIITVIVWILLREKTRIKLKNILHKGELL